MPWNYTPEYYREYTRTTWNETAAEWNRVQRLLEPYSFDLLNGTDAKVRERILDLATGPGEPALSLARIVGAEGRVVGIDLSDKMIGIATQAAAERRLANAEFRVMDAEHLDFPDGTFDAVVSRFGFQIFTDPVAVAREAYRVLRPGGRIAIAVWSTAERAAALHVLVGPMLEFAEPDETGYIPTPYELGGEGEMTAMLAGVGFTDLREERHSHEFVTANEEEYLDAMLHGTPMGHSLREESPEVQRQILAKTRQNLQAWRTPDGIRIPCECVVVTGRRGSTSAPT